MNKIENLELELLKDSYLIGKKFGKFNPFETEKENFLCIVKDKKSSTIICRSDFEPSNLTSVSKGWRAFYIKAELDFTISGILVSILIPLSNAGLSVFVSSNFDTDYIFVKEDSLAIAMKELSKAGYPFLIGRN